MARLINDNDIIIDDNNDNDVIILMTMILMK